MARFNAAAVLAKLETVYGTDAAPLATANAMLFQEVDWTPLEAEQVDRPMVLPWYGNDPFLVTARRALLAGATDLSGAGAVGTAPPWAVLARACGLAETVTAGVRVDYGPVSAAEEACTLYHFLDGTRHVGLGSRGDFSIELEAGQLPRVRWSMQGLYVAPTAVALPVPTLTGWQAPLVVNQANVPACTVGGVAVVLQRFSYTHGNQIVMRDMPNQRAVRITGRQPRATITFDAPDALATDFFALVGTLTAVQVRLGSAAGFITQVDLLQARIAPNPRYGNDNGIASLTLELRPEPTAAGNDELRIRVQ